MIPMAIILGIGFVVGFIWAARSGQFDDLESPAHRMLTDDWNIYKSNKFNNEKKGSHL